MKQTPWLAAALLLVALAPAQAGLLTAKNPNARADKNGASAAEPRACESQGVRLQVLGSGGEEPLPGRAGASYLLWIDGRARALVDAGAGMMLRFAEVGANIGDLDTILLTRLHTDRTAGLPALVQSPARERPLPIYGPAGDRGMPSTVAFVRALFDSTRGAWRHLGGRLNPMARDTYKLQPHDVAPRPRPLGMPAKETEPVLAVFANDRLRARALVLAAGPALAWRVDAGGKSVVFAARTDDAVARLAQETDLLIVQPSQPEDAGGAARLARAAGAKQMVLATRTRATLGHEQEMLEEIRKVYTGPVTFANDLDCFTP